MDANPNQSFDTDTNPFIELVNSFELSLKVYYKNVYYFF